MSRFGQLVMGPAGCGKSTYCALMKEHFLAQKKTIRIINLDPASEEPFPYGQPDIDIRDLISSDDVMDELDFGPNGGLMFAMEYFGQNLDWIQKQLDEYGDDEYFIFDCPGQIELYVHHPIMRQLVENLQRQQAIRLCGVFLIDATFIRDAAKFVSASLMTLNTMVHLELPHLNVLSKADLLEDVNVGNVIVDQDDIEYHGNENHGSDFDTDSDSDDSDKESDNDSDCMDDLDLVNNASGSSRYKASAAYGRSMRPTANPHLRNEFSASDSRRLLGKKKAGKRYRGEGKKQMTLADLDRFLDNDVESLLPDLHSSMHPRYKDLNVALIGLLEEYRMVSYAALNPKDDDSLETIAHRINDLIQFYEHQEVDDTQLDKMDTIHENREERFAEQQERIKENQNDDYDDQDHDNDDEISNADSIYDEKKTKDFARYMESLNDGLAEMSVDDALQDAA